MRLTKYLLLTLCFAISVTSIWTEAQASPDRYTVFFDSYSSTPKTDSIKTLESIKEEIKSAPPASIVVSGHADAGENQSGTNNTTDYKSTLSNMRADFVSKWLSSGIENPLNIKKFGYGDTRPAGKQADSNRRVEIVVYKGGAMDSGKKPVVAIPEKSHVFEEVLEDTKVVHDFVIKNTGDAVLNIIKVNPG